MVTDHDFEQGTFDDLLLQYWKTSAVFNSQQAPRPSNCAFVNTVKGLELLNKHLNNKSKIALHTDVDMDGIGTTYILKKALSMLDCNNTLLIINKDKEHGVNVRHNMYFAQHPIDLIIITDSSSNELEVLKGFTCDVLCIDHHDLVHNELSGKCNDGIHDFVIINNTIENYSQDKDILWLKNKNPLAYQNIERYQATDAMSCGVVIYEFLRNYFNCYVKDGEQVLFNMYLYQWAAITLFTDIIDTLNDRNQWYMDNTVFSNNVESTLRILMNQLNRFCVTPDKSFICFTLAPLVNKAIRAGFSSVALNIIINTPELITNLKEYEVYQTAAIDKACYIIDMYGNRNKIVFDTPSIMLDIEKLGISKNYSGIIASRLLGENGKNSAVYVSGADGRISGSFRGRLKDFSYRKVFANYSPDIYAQGHGNAFGFKLTKEQLIDIMNYITTVEKSDESKRLITIGSANADFQDAFHINDINSFRQAGNIYKLAIGNSKVNTSDELMIKVKACDVVLKSTKGKLYIYDVFGMECKAFKPLVGEYFDIYIEYANEVIIYIR